MSRHSSELHNMHTEIEWKVDYYIVQLKKKNFLNQPGDDFLGSFTKWPSVYMVVFFIQFLHPSFLYLPDIQVDVH